MAAISTPTVPGPRPRAAPPRLENGDRLTRAEFERRYAAMPQVRKAELIEGIVHMPSPVSRHHAAPHADLMSEYVDLPVEGGLIKSRVFPGLWLDVAGLLNGQSAEVLAQLQHGLAAHEHTGFTAQLSSRLRG